MKLTLRNLALGTALVAAGAMFAQDAPTVTLKWRTHEGASANTRGGNALNGVVYVGNGKDIVAIDGTKPEGQQATTYMSFDYDINKGFFMDDAGNILISHWCLDGDYAWDKYQLVKASDKSVTDVTIQTPEATMFVGGRDDLGGRAIGDFFSEEGGLGFLCASGSKYTIPLFFQNGEQYIFDAGSSAENETAANTTPYAVPSIESLADVEDTDEIPNLFYMAATNGAPVMYVNEDGEAAYVANPAVGVPEGWDRSKNNGFDTFVLGDKRYFIFPMGKQAWGSNFVISDEEGNVIFVADNEPGGDWNNLATGGNAGSGSGVWARKVSDYKVEVYQLFCTSLAGKAFTAMYEVTIPETPIEVPTIYIAGTEMGWNVGADAAKFTFDGEKYTYSFHGNDFKLTTDATNWDTFDANAIRPKGGVLNLLPGATYELEPGTTEYGKNLTIVNGDYTLIIDKEITTITVQGEAKFVAPELYLRGAFNEWATTAKFAYNPEPVDGKVVYTVSVPSFTGAFLVTTEGYAPKYGGATFDELGTQTLEQGAGDNMCNVEVTDATLTFVLPVDATVNPTLTIEGTVPGPVFEGDGRKPFAYAISAEEGQNGKYTVSYKATAASEAAVVVLTNAEGIQIAKGIGAAVAGENTAELDLAGMEEGTYTWGISLQGKVEGTEPVCVATQPIAATASEYVGLTVIRDPEVEAFGYTVVGMSGQHGYLVYNPAGELQYGGAIHAEWQAANFKNGGSNTMYAGSYLGYAVFANWNDQAAGLWVVNPLDKNENPYNMYASEGATMASSGLWSIGDVAIGGGSTGVAFANLGEETLVVNFDEDYGTGNDAYTRRIKTGDKYITVPPTFTLGQYASQFGGFCTSTKGYFAGSSRADAADQANPVLRYYNFDNELLYNTADEGCALTSCCGTVACNADGSLFALTERQGPTHVYSVEYTDNVPTFTELYTVPTDPALNSRPDMDFDAANNLHIADRKNSTYTVYAMPGTSMSYTAAPASMAFAVTTGIEAIAADAADAAVEYFNLQGIRVAADNLTPGIYVRRQGNTTAKVLVK